MPAGILPDIGIGDLLEYMIKRAIGGVVAWELMFFKNDIEPDCSTTIESLTEADFDGYERLTLDRDTWTVPEVDTCCARSTWGTIAQVWTVLGGPAQTLYGYAFVDPTSNILRFIQRFDAEDIHELEVGEKVILLPAFTLTSAECEEEEP